MEDTGEQLQAGQEWREMTFKKNRRECRLSSHSTGPLRGVHCTQQPELSGLEDRFPRGQSDCKSWKEAPETRGRGADRTLCAPAYKLRS